MYFCFRVYSTERNNPVNLQYLVFFLNLREEVMCTLHYYTSMLLSVTVEKVESTVQNVETKGNSIYLTSFSHRKFFHLFGIT